MMEKMFLDELKRLEGLTEAEMLEEKGVKPEYYDNFCGVTDKDDALTIHEKTKAKHQRTIKNRRLHNKKNLNKALHENYCSGYYYVDEKYTRESYFKEIPERKIEEEIVVWNIVKSYGGFYTICPKIEKVLVIIPAKTIKRHKVTIEKLEKPYVKRFRGCSATRKTIKKMTNAKMRHLPIPYYDEDETMF